MYRFLVKATCFATVCALVIMLGNAALAWEQPTHKQINYEAAKVFWRTFPLSNMDKYKKGSFVSRSFVTSRYRGIAVTSSGMFQKDYTKAEETLSLVDWVVMGGDWADEPHLYASVRHFYDPKSMWGVPYLTDQSEVHSWYDDPQTDARTWGLSDPDNPFSFQTALEYYKNAMETPEDVYVQVGPGNHWKTDVTFGVQNSDEVRNIYLGLAYRALGETMHMLADMTQPAHVRNDSHPFDEPVETGVKPYHVSAAASAPILDGRMARFLASAGGTLQDPRSLFRYAALWTNQFFYSADTIFDREEEVIPTNMKYEEYIAGEKKPYERPQFKNLTVKDGPVTGFIFKRPTKRLFGVFNSEEVPMAQERLSFHWFDPDMTIKEKIARRGSVGPYQISRSEHAAHQARALIPAAVYACADLMHLFFPTMELKAQFGEPETEDDAGYTRQVMDMHAQMLHHQDQDPGWQFAGLNIAYTGPGNLVFADDKGAVQKTRDLYFDQGELLMFKNSDGEMVEDILCVYISSGTPLSPEEAYYEATDGTVLYFQVEAGSRVFRSEEYTISSDVAVEILGGDVNYELVEGETEYEHTFTAAAAPGGNYRYDWDFGNGSATSDTPASGSNSVVSNKYADGIFTVTVDLVDPVSEDVLASDSVSITVIEDLRDYTLEACNTWTASQGGGYGTTVDVWDISTLPDGTTFDITFDAYSVPDKFVVQYSGGTVLDTGWRGDQYYVDNNPGMYPGGLSGTGSGTANAIFTKSGGNTSFRVIVYGPDTGTSWTYSIRPNCP